MCKGVQLDNVLTGNAGDNRLNGGNGGHDRLTGGDGVDTFCFVTLTASIGSPTSRTAGDGSTSARLMESASFDDLNLV